VRVGVHAGVSRGCGLPQRCQLVPNRGVGLCILVLWRTATITALHDYSEAGPE
jgi:hypothetical protein